MEAIDIEAFRLDFLQRLREALQEAKDAYPSEARAARQIQRIFRGFRVRTRLFELHYFAREIQRVYRGHLARRAARRLLDLRVASWRAAVEHNCAAVVQRVFRGYWCRKYVHDFHARREYLARVAAEGEAMRSQMAEQREAQAAAAAAAEEERARRAFERATRGLHHLVSTAAQPGVYNPPYAASMGEVPSAFGIPLETHLRVATLRQLRTEGLHATGVQPPSPSPEEKRRERAGEPEPLLEGRTLPRVPAGMAPAAAAGLTVAAFAARSTAATAIPTPAASIGTAHISLVPAYAAEGARRSLQASTPYGVEKVAAAAEAKFSRLLELDQKPFLAGTRSRHFEEPHALGVHATAPFRESHLLARSEKETELAASGKWIGGAPFVASSSRTPGLFEAEERRRVAATAAAVHAAGAAGPLGLDPAALAIAEPPIGAVNTRGQTRLLSTATRALSAGLATQPALSTIRHGDAAVAVGRVDEPFGGTAVEAGEARGRGAVPARRRSSAGGAGGVAASGGWLPAGSAASAISARRATGGLALPPGGDGEGLPPSAAGGASAGSGPPPSMGDSRMSVTPGAFLAKPWGPPGASAGVPIPKGPAGAMATTGLGGGLLAAGTGALAGLPLGSTAATLMPTRPRPPMRPIVHRDPADSPPAATRLGGT